MNDPQLLRIERMVSVLISMVAPTMSFREVGQVLGLKSYRATKLWLEQHGIHPRGRRYERAAVIAAQTQ
jgi:hypothetical protein